MHIKGLLLKRQAFREIEETDWGQFRKEVEVEWGKGALESMPEAHERFYESMDKK